MNIDDEVMSVSISLFSSSGIGDLGIEYGCNIPVIISAELLPERVSLIQHNYPKCKVIEGDILETKSDIILSSKKILDGKRPLLMTLSPPCQGMSTTAAGLWSNQVKKGKKPKHDERNKLLLPGLEIIKQLQPEYFLIENVENMKNTIIEWKKKKPKRLINLIKPEIGSGYDIHSFVVDFANYQVPHTRKRLITIGKRTKQKNTNFKLYHEGPPNWFDSGEEDNQISILKAISYLCKPKKGDLLRQSIPLNKDHQLWISNIPKYSGKTAFLNNCIQKSCKHHEPTDSIYCSKCSKPLPRPSMEDKSTSKLRLIKGRASTYKRMPPHVPAKTITMSSGVPSSDNNIHYSQNRVLNLKEVMVLTTFCNIENKAKNIVSDYPWHGKYDFSFAMEDEDYLIQKNIIRQSLGESIPPLAMQRMIKSLLKW